MAWVFAGGNLWVSPLGDKWQRLPELERLLGPATGEVQADRIGPPAAWQRPDAKRLKAILGELSNLSLVEGDEALSSGKNTVRALVERARRRKSRPEAPFRFRPYGLGQVVAFGGEAFPGDVVCWRWLLETMAGRSSWSCRHGLSPDQPNVGFWDFLIPGVGQTPVAAFCTMISLFVVLIGPVNYFLLRRARRLHLLVLTIPAGAALVTLGLFAYALLSDGFATRVRVRSFTWIDQRQGQAACWARLSYYAGLSPGGGLIVPADVAWIPYLAESSRGGWRTAEKTVEWEQEQQHWSANWLPSRTPTQFLSVRSRPSLSGLSVAAAPGAEKIRVTNRLGTPIRELVVRVGDGYYHGSQIDGTDPVLLGRIDSAAVTDLLRPIFEQNEPVSPPGLTVTRRGWGRAARALPVSSIFPAGRGPACWKRACMGPTWWPWASSPAATWRSSIARPRSSWACAGRRRRPAFT